MMHPTQKFGVRRRFRSFNAVVVWTLVLIASAGMGSQAGAAEIKYVEPAILGMPQREIIDLGNRMVDLRAASGTMSDQIAKARARYWQAFPDGPGFESAKREYDSALWQKDVVYFMFAVEATKANEPFIDVLKRLAGKIDGGIRPSAYFAFEQWASAVKWHLAGNHPEDVIVLVLNPVKLVGALAESAPQMAAYRRARDWAEFSASGIDLTRYIDPKICALRLIEERLIGWEPEYAPNQPDTLVQAGHVYDLMVQAAGEKDVLAAASAVMAAKKNDDGDLSTPIAALSADSGTQPTRDPFAFLESLVINANARSFAVAMLMGGTGAGMDYEAAWKTGADRYAALVAKYG